MYFEFSFQVNYQLKLTHLPPNTIIFLYENNFYGILQDHRKSYCTVTSL